MDEVINAMTYQQRLLDDPHRPRYHFAIPGDDGNPGDPNGAFFADGLYHLMYLYHSSEQNGFHWGHLTSRDLLHWRRHKDALTVHEGDGGCFSGGAFVDEDGTAYLTFWKFAALDPAKDRSGIALAKAEPPYEDWTRMEPIAINGSEWGILDMEVDGEMLHLGNADPSNIFKCGSYYYMQTGNLCVLDKYGRGEDAPEKYRGGWTELFRSEDLKTWTFLHRFYPNTYTGENGWPDATEDDMCPGFLPLYDAREGGAFTGKWLQTFIAHNRGCQYFIGTWENECFTPERHGRMSWKDKAFFAPETLVDDRNRHLLWAWLLDDREKEFARFGWSGVYSFPRMLWLEGDTLRMAPADELEKLQYNGQTLDPAADVFPVKTGDAFRLKASWAAPSAPVGIRVREDAARGEYTDILVDPMAGKLVFDATHSGTEGWKICEEAPFALKPGEPLSLDIFVDASVVEVYANERQAICRRVYPTCPAKAMGVRPLGAPAKAVKAWSMAPTNLY